MSNDLLTVEQLKQVLPSQFKGQVSPTFVNQLNQTLADPAMYGVYRDNILGYVGILKEGKFKLVDYIQAVKYCSHRIAGSTQIDAFVKTFPQRYQKFLASGTSQKDIASYISSYNKNKLVNLIMEQSLIPSYILNQDLYQEALNIQAELMRSASSEKVRSDAANSLLNHLTPPEVKKVELDIGIKADTSLLDLKRGIIELATNQQEAIQRNVIDVSDVRHQKLVEYVEDED